MNRERTAWLASVVLIALLAFQLSGSIAHRDDEYAFVRTLVDIHRYVSNSYVEPVDEEKLRQGAIDGMMQQLDPFSVYVPPKEQEGFDRLLEGTFKGVGIQLDQLDNGDIEVVSPIEDSPAFKAGVLAGDIILKVNGEEIKNQKLKDVITRISTGPLEVKMRVRHATGEEVDLPTMIRREIVVPTVKGYRRKPDGHWDYYVSPDPKIAYVRITQFTADTFDKLKATLEGLIADGMKGLVLDLRFNPGGRLDQAEQVVNLFIKQGVIVSTKGRDRPELISTAKPGGALAADFPVIVLVNEHSASASEIVAGSLMDNRRALVLGTRTYGKGSVQELIQLDNKGGELKLTVAYYYLPSGRLVHRKKDATDWGVEPQINVPMDAVAERRLIEEQSSLEVIGRPLPRATSKPATSPVTPAHPATQPATQPAGPFVDAQLEAAVSTMIGHVILQGQHPGRDLVSSTVPATQPARQGESE